MEEPSGPLSSLSFGNGLTETRGFTNRYFPESIELSGGSTLFDWAYTQDNEGNVLAITDGVAPAGNRSYTYQDHQYFLTAGVGPWGGITWTYDQIGNRLSEQRGALTDVYHYDQNAASGNTPLLEAVALGVGGTRDYTYGQAGHVEQVSADINQTFFENAQDSRLTRLERPTGDAATDFLYDGRSFLTRSIQRSHDNLLTDGFEFGHTGCWTLQEGGVQGPPGPECFQQVTRPVYSSEGLLHALLKTNGPAPTSESHYLLYFAGRPVLQLAVGAQGGSTYGYLTTDHLGTPAALCDEAGTLLWQGGLEPFGADSFSGAGGAGVYLRFPGQWVDGTWAGSSAGEPLSNNVHRWYYDSAGRYNRTDPLGVEAGVNVFLYASSNPLSYVDTLALQPSCCSKSWSDCWGTCIRARRLNFWQVIPFSALPKRVLPPFRVPLARQPLTTIPSSMGHLLGGRSTTAGSALRTAGRILHRVATPVVIFEGFYDATTVIACAGECSSDPCRRFLPISDLLTLRPADLLFLE